MTEAASLLQAGSLATSLAVALGTGLLVGAERERRRAEGTLATAAGIRTYALTSLAGALAMALGGPLLLSAIALALAGLIALSYWRTQQEDPGLTSEVALAAVLLVGALSIERPALAAGTGVAIAVILAGRRALHHFIGTIVTQQEMKEALLLAAATLVILPILPAEPLPGMGSVSLQRIWLLTIMVMAVGAVAHVAMRVAGEKVGSLIAGFLSGFASGTATVGAMAALAARQPERRPAAVAAAVVSQLATLTLLAAIVATFAPRALEQLWPSLAAAGALALVATTFHVGAGWRRPPPAQAAPGKAFSLWHSILFAVALALLIALSAALYRHYGLEGVLAAAALTGLADLHAAAASVAALAGAGQIPPAAAAIPVLVALSANTFTKAAVAFAMGGRAFGLRVAPVLALMVLAAWAGWVFKLPAASHP